MLFTNQSAHAGRFETSLQVKYWIKKIWVRIDQTNLLGVPNPSSPQKEWNQSILWILFRPEFQSLQMNGMLSQTKTMEIFLWILGKDALITNIRTTSHFAALRMSPFILSCQKRIEWPIDSFYLHPDSMQENLWALDWMIFWHICPSCACINNIEPEKILRIDEGRTVLWFLFLAPSSTSLLSKSMGTIHWL